MTFPGRFLFYAIVALWAVASGCRNAERKAVQDPWPVVEALLEQNSEILKSKGHMILPTKQDWVRLDLEYFRGGLALNWSSGGVGPLSGGLLFREDGTFLCSALHYIPIDVTGDGVRDLVTTGIGGMGIGFFVYDLARPVASPIFLGSMIKYSMTKGNYPAVWDADGDGTFEIITCGPPNGVPHNCGLDTAALEAEEIEWVVMVWSLKRGVPRIVLALSTMDEYEYSFHSPWFLGLSIARKSVTWDAAAGHFQVPDLEGLRVLINRGGFRGQDTDFC